MSEVKSRAVSEATNKRGSERSHLSEYCTKGSEWGGHPLSVKVE